LIQLILQVSFNIIHALSIHAWAACAFLYSKVGIPYQRLWYIKRLCRTHTFLPLQVDACIRLNDAAPLLHSLSTASPLLRAAPSLCLASVGFSFRGQLLRISPFASRRQVPTFPTKA